MITVLTIIYLNHFPLNKSSYQLDDGSFFQEAGKINDNGQQEVAGQYSFIGANGVVYWVKYTADEDGYHPIVGNDSNHKTQPNQIYH